MKTPPGKVIVTGAGGFVGRWVLDELRRVAPNVAVVACHGAGAAPPAEGREAVQLDVRDTAAVEALVARVKPDGIIHLAAVSRIAESQKRPRETWDINLCGTMNLAYAALRHAPGCRFVFAGSGDTYGGSFREIDGNVNETAPLAPLNVYAATKSAADLMLGQLANEGLPSLRMRPFNHIGPRQSDRYAATAFAAQIARIEAGLQPPLMRVGNLEAMRDVIDVRDVARAYVGALVGPQGWRAGDIANLCCGSPVSIREVLEILLSYACTPIEVAFDPALSRPIDLPRMGGDPSRARAILGWTPRIPLGDTLRDILDDWRARVEDDS